MWFLRDGDVTLFDHSAHIAVTPRGNGDCEPRSLELALETQHEHEITTFYSLPTLLGNKA